MNVVQIITCAMVLVNLSSNQFIVNLLQNKKLCDVQYASQGMTLKSVLPNNETKQITYNSSSLTSLQFAAALCCVLLQIWKKVVTLRNNILPRPSVLIDGA